MVINEFDVAMIVGNPSFSICFVTKVYSQQQQQQHNFELVSVPPVLAKNTTTVHILVGLTRHFPSPGANFFLHRSTWYAKSSCRKKEPQKMMLKQYILSGKLTWL